MAPPVVDVHTNSDVFCFFFFPSVRHQKSLKVTYNIACTVKDVMMTNLSSFSIPHIPMYRISCRKMDGVGP